MSEIPGYNPNEQKPNDDPQADANEARRTLDKWKEHDAANSDNSEEDQGDSSENPTE